MKLPYHDVIMIMVLLCSSISASDAFLCPNIRNPSATVSSNTKLFDGVEKSLAELEDLEEKRLDSQEAAATLSHQMRAPVKLAQSSNTFNAQEATFGEEDAEALERQRTIRQFLAEDDEQWKQERRKKLLGKYADVTSKEEMEKLNEEMKMEIEQGAFPPLYNTSNLFLLYRHNDHASSQIHSFAFFFSENKRKSELAQSQGITFDVIEKDVLPTEESNFKPSNIKGKSQASWFEELDKEIQSNAGLVDNEDGPQIINGKLVSREEQQGIRVGSAGGWTLEVYPGDFVVHRKYGIGRFEKTVIKPKTKLSEEEKKAQASRRNDIVKQMVQERKDASEIDSFVSKFGTEDDLDPISNPQQTVLEVAYSDAMVHIPVDKAYRLSRYRAGDAVVKPRLSRIKGEAWNRAKQKVEEDTLQMAQDVLALYATREILTRTPFDPAKEGE